MEHVTVSGTAPPHFISFILCVCVCVCLCMCVKMSKWATIQFFFLKHKIAAFMEKIGNKTAEN